MGVGTVLGVTLLASAAVTLAATAARLVPTAYPETRLLLAAALFVGVATTACVLTDRLTGLWTASVPAVPAGGRPGPCSHTG